MPETDASLVGRSAAGDADAFAGLLHRHGPAVHAYLARRCGREDADDLLSEVWLRAFAARSSHDRQWPDARPWLYGIARNVLRAHWRRLGQPLPPAGPASSDPWPEVDAQIDAAAQVTALRRALAALPGDDREVLLLVTGRAWPRPRWPSRSAYPRAPPAAACTAPGPTSRWSR